MRQISLYEGTEPLRINKPIRLIELPIGSGVVIGVSADGDIYTQTKTGIRKNGTKDNRRGVRIKPTIDKYGYLRCTFSNGGVRKSYYVHRLVAQAFVKNPCGKPTVNHINGVKTDNRAENLEWATHKEQKLHALRKGLAENNTIALKRANDRRKVAIKYHGREYASIREASRAEQRAQATIRKYGEVVPCKDSFQCLRDKSGY